MFVAVTGVSGSGKSTLIEDKFCIARWRGISIAPRVIPGEHRPHPQFEHIDKVIDIDQKSDRPRRARATNYAGLFTPVRELFAEVPEAKIRGYGPNDSRST